jgi:hypothetical protein
MLGNSKKMSILMSTGAGGDTGCIAGGRVINE